MPRAHKPTNLTQKKESQKLKRAIKRGDVEVSPDAAKANRKNRMRKGHMMRSVAGAEADSSKRLQSAFVKLPASFLAETLTLSASLILPRPIPTSLSILPDDFDSGGGILTCPTRPPWNFNMSKKELEKGEESVFQKWLVQSDKLVEEWREAAQVAPATDDADAAPLPVTSMPRSTTYYERNIEVWRQLWRVTEISQIILVLLDSRCPLLHYPPSLSTYLSKKKHILVLTKVDIAGPERVAAWIDHLQAKHPMIRIVQVEAYAEREVGASHQGRKHYDPHLPDTFRHRFVETLREVHAELLEPPEAVKSNPKRLQHWRPQVKTDVDWDAIHHARGEKVGTAVGGAVVPAEGEEDTEPQFLTVGLIGQPNVGKSSLLNALFGRQKVQASKTPGKTKHFQTLFWTPELRLVDCPGLVMPNFVPMEMQVLSGILPIARISSIPSCIHFASERLPLEEIFSLPHPNPPAADPLEDKRTWRGGDPQRQRSVKALEWTAMDILTSYAERKGWITAKAGRPDVKRAGNAILRSLAESRVAWAFWPSGTDLSTTSTADGLWIPEGGIEEEKEDDGSDAEALVPSDDDDTTGESMSGSEEEDSEVEVAGAGRFAMLSLVEDE